MHITMYSTSICSTCNALGKWLERNGFSYDKKIVDTDPALMEEFIGISDGLISVPFTVLTDHNGVQTKISGYDRNAFKTAFDL
jgi:glutaredoxin